MIKETLKELLITVKYNRKSGNILIIVLYVIFIAAAVMPGNLYPIVFIAFSLVTFGGLMITGRVDVNVISEFMIPLSDEERKKQYFCRVIVYSAVCSLILFTGNIIAMIFGGHNRIHDNFICVILLHLIGVCLAAEMPLDLDFGRKSLSKRLRDIIPETAGLVYWFVSLSLLRENTGKWSSRLDLYEDFGRNGIMVIEIAVIVLQLIHLKYLAGKSVMYEYDMINIIQEPEKKGVKKR